MPALDRDHNIVRNALIEDGWTITHDPLRLRYKERDLYVDLGAEQVLGAERGLDKIAVEVKGFSGMSDVAELHRATGQYVIYAALLQRIEPERRLILAVPDDIIRSLFQGDIGEVVLQDGVLRVVGYDPETEKLTQWLP